MPIQNKKKILVRGVIKVPRLLFMAVFLYFFSSHNTSYGQVCGDLGDYCCYTDFSGTSAYACQEGEAYGSPENCWCNSTDDQPLICDISNLTSPSYLHCISCVADSVGDSCCPGDTCGGALLCNTDTGLCEEPAESCGGENMECCTYGDRDEIQYSCNTGLSCNESVDPPICVQPSTCGDYGEPCCYSDRYEVWTCNDGIACNIDNMCVLRCNSVGAGCCTDANGEGYCQGALSCDNSSEYRCVMYEEDTDPEPCGLANNQKCCNYASNPPDAVPYGDTDHNGCVEPLLSVSYTTSTGSVCNCQNPDDCGGVGEICCYASSGPDVAGYCDTYTIGCNTDGVCVPLEDYQLNYTPFEGYIIPDITSLLAPIFKILFYAGIAVGILAIILSGYLLMSSEGDPNKVKEAKEQFSASIFGIMFILLSLFLLRVIINNILGADLGF